MPVPNDYDPSQTKGESKHLRAQDFPLDQKWRLVISDMDLEMMEARDGKPARNKLVMSFEGKEKGLVLNATNQEFMEQRLGFGPNDWIGATVVLWRTTTKYEGKQVPAFRFLEAKKGAAKSKPKPKDEPIEVEPLSEDDMGGDDSVPF